MNGGKICVSLRAESHEELVSDIAAAAAYADIIEIRLDFAPSDSLMSIVDGLPEIAVPYLLTLRPSEQGGARQIDVAERTEFWARVRASGRPFLIDLEHDFAADKADVVSYHDFDGVNADLDGICNRLRGQAPQAVIKIACAVETVTEAIPVFRLLDGAKQSARKITPIAMGEAGEWTRILGLAHGATMTYASLASDSATAAGQLTTRELTERYRAKEISPETKVFAIIGDPVSHSLSPAIHNAAFQASAEDAVFIRLPVVDIEEFMARMVIGATREVELNFAGFAVTMPHKRSIIPFLDEVDETAAAVDAVNTIRINDGRLTGYNTDVQGFIEPLKRRIGRVKDCRVAIVGAGGAARACVYGLTQEGADVTIFARDLRMAEELATEFGARAEQYQSGNARAETFDVLVNATPIGMNHDDRPIAIAGQISNLKLVYDLVTSREDTALIREAKHAGVPTITGEEMLLEQGAAQFEIWTGRKAPRRAMEHALANL